MLSAALKRTPITKARTGPRCTIEALAKGCHKLWVKRHKNKRKVGPSRQRQVSEGKEDDILFESDMSWVEIYFVRHH